MHDMDEGARRWLHKTARQHYWRVASYIDLDDLIQDGYLEYHRIVTRYAETAKTRAQIMALFKRVFHMRLHDLANARTKSVPEVLYSDIAVEGASEAAVWERLVATADTDFMFFVEAPKPVRDVLSVLQTERGIRRLRARPRHRADTGQRWTLNDRLCGLLGVDPKSVDLATALRNYLLGIADETNPAV